MNDAPATEGLPPSLRFLKGLVTILTITMIAGVITIVALLVTRMPDGSPGLLPLPAALTLPVGAVPLAVTQGPDWIGVVTTDNRMLIFAPDGSLLQEIIVSPPN